MNTETITEAADLIMARSSTMVEELTAQVVHTQPLQNPTPPGVLAGVAAAVSGRGLAPRDPVHDTTVLPACALAVVDSENRIFNLNAA